MRYSQESFTLVDDPLWFKDAVIYELHPRAFFDSNGDGIGDFDGLAQKLDYLQDLGVTAIWLLPFYPSPLKDDGYDISDYTDVHRAYGTLHDFKEFLREAHRRGLRVITELVVNHTSDQHPWFQRARTSPAGSPEREYYVWSDTPERYRQARIIFQDFESSNWAFDPVTSQYFWHRFYSHQPDLNYANHRVRRGILNVVDHWLEMVTDEERDYMYRVYASDPQARINLGIRRRLAPLLGNDRRVIEVINGLLFSLPGTPVIYYGDEIGMGDNIYLGDRNGVRTPMQWSSDRNAGFSRVNPQQLYLPVVVGPEYHYESLNVEAQQDNRRILVFIRRHEDERILVVVNLARSVQYVELDLSAYRGLVPHELFGATEFPSIGELPYFLTLGPHSFYWFRLEPQTVDGDVGATRRPPELEVAGSWRNVLAKANRPPLEEALPGFLRGSRWFGGKARRIRSTEIVEEIPVGDDSQVVGVIALVSVEYAEGDRIDAVPTKAFRRIAGTSGDVPEARPLQAEQSNSSVVFGDRLVLKLYRRLERGVNPDLEVGRFLTDRANFEHIAPVAGGLELRQGQGQPFMLGILHGYVPNEGDAWSFTLDRVREYLEGALACAAAHPELRSPERTLHDVVSSGVPNIAVETIGSYLES